MLALFGLPTLSDLRVGLMDDGAQYVLDITLTRLVPWPIAVLGLDEWLINEYSLGRVTVGWEA